MTLTSPAREPAIRKGSVAGIVLTLLESRQTVTRSQVAAALQAAGNPARDESVASALSRMVSRGLITKVGHGVYRRAERIG